LEQGLLGGTVGQSFRKLPGGGSHFVPGFTKGIHRFLFGHFSGEFGQLELEENQAEGILEDAGFRILWEMLFEVQILYPLDDFLRVMELAQDPARRFRVELFEVRAPLQVAGAGHRIRVAGHLPAADVLGAGGESQGFGSVRAEPQHPIRQSFRVKEFPRLGMA